MNIEESSMNNYSIDTKVNEVVICCLNEIGIIVNPSMIEESDVNIFDYQIDSLTFMSFLVDLEERLNITIPDIYLDFGVLQSLKGFINLITQLVIDSNSNEPVKDSFDI